MGLGLRSGLKFGCWLGLGLNLTRLKTENRHTDRHTDFVMYRVATQLIRWSSKPEILFTEVEGYIFFFW